MRNEKLYPSLDKNSLQPAADAVQSPPVVPRSADLVWKPEEGLRLFRAFTRIRDSSRRAWLIAEAEKLSSSQSGR